MFDFGEERNTRDEVYQKHEAKFSHELIGGAASFEAMKLFEDHQRKEGQPVKHAFAKELLAGFAGAEVDKLAETKGMDWEEREKAKHHAKQRAEKMYDQQYGEFDEYHPHHKQRHQAFDY